MNISSVTGVMNPYSSSSAINGAPGASGSSGIGGSGDDPVAAFEAYASETPAQQMRDSVLRQLGLTEKDVDNMSPSDRAKVEEKIKEIIQQKVQESTEKKTGVVVDLKA